MWKELKVGARFGTPPPDWVVEASDRYYYGCVMRPYNQTKYFKGRTYNV